MKTHDSQDGTSLAQATLQLNEDFVMTTGPIAENVPYHVVETDGAAVVARNGLPAGAGVVRGDGLVAGSGGGAVTVVTGAVTWKSQKPQKKRMSKKSARTRRGADAVGLETVTETAAGADPAIANGARDLDPRNASTRSKRSQA